MAKHTYHFKHDFNAHNDEKILDLRMELGFEGYGIFWYLIENLASAEDYKLENNYKRIGFSSGANPETIKKVIENFELFIVENDFFWSESLMDRMKRLDEIKLKRAEIGSKGGKAKAIGKQLVSKGLANLSRVKESKGEESKVNESKEERTKEKKSCDLFLEIWNNSSWTKKYAPHSESLKEKIDKNISRIANEYGENFFIDFKKALEEKAFIKDQTWFNAPNVATRKEVLERFLNGTYDFMGEKKISTNRPLKNDISNFYQNNEFME